MSWKLVAALREWFLESGCACGRTTSECAAVLAEIESESTEGSAIGGQNPQVFGQSVEKYSSALSLRLANGRTPTIAVRYRAGKLNASAGAGTWRSEPRGFQVQTFIGSTMFLKR